QNGSGRTRGGDLPGAPRLSQRERVTSKRHTDFLFAKGSRSLLPSSTVDDAHRLRPPVNPGPAFPARNSRGVRIRASGRPLGFRPVSQPAHDLPGHTHKMWTAARGEVRQRQNRVTTRRPSQGRPADWEETHVNKTELIESIGGRLGDRKAATAALEAVLAEIQNAVTKGDKVSITGFGVFERLERAARTDRNPRTGESVK